MNDNNDNNDHQYIITMDVVAAGHGIITITLLGDYHHYNIDYKNLELLD
jgi:VCBS repeat-containing protein